MARTVEEEKNSRRKERIPLGGGRMKLAAPDDHPGWVRRWINDSAGRLAQAEAAGYSFVRDPAAPKSSDQIQEAIETTDQGSSMSRIVGSAREGGGMRAYLMEIPKDLYEEDQREKQSHLDDIDRQIDKGRFENKIGEQFKHPDPNLKVQISRPVTPT